MRSYSHKNSWADAWRGIKPLIINKSRMHCQNVVNSWTLHFVQNLWKLMKLTPSCVYIPLQCLNSSLLFKKSITWGISSKSFLSSTWANIRCNCTPNQIKDWSLKFAIWPQNKSPPPTTDNQSDPLFFSLLVLIVGSLFNIERKKSSYEIGVLRNNYSLPSISRIILLAITNLCNKVIFLEV